MKSFIVNIICCFIPYRKTRHKLRHMVCKNTYKINGTNNKIYIGKTLYKSPIPGLTIEINGNNNNIYIPTTYHFENCYFRIYANNSEIKIQDTTKKIRNLVVNACCGENQKLYIGKNFHCHGVDIQLNEENASLYIGDDCLFSRLITIWPTDGHSIQDLKTNQVINNITRPVKIGNHCWVGESVKILKNVEIGCDCVIGAGSVVSKKFSQNNIIIAGNPGKIIKQNITWDEITAAIKTKTQKND